MRVTAAEPRLCCRDDQRQMVSHELATILVSHSRCLLEAEECPDGFLRNANRPNPSVDPDVDERVGAARAYRIVLHGAFPQAQAIFGRMLAQRAAAFQQSRLCSCRVSLGCALYERRSEEHTS